MSGKSPITCHVLDASLGKPAVDVEIRLQEYHAAQFEDGPFVFEPLGEGKTDADGRCTTLLTPEDPVTKAAIKAGGVYKIIFRTKEYFERTGRKSFYPWVEIPFEIADPNEHYHIPLLISPYSYTTYRGS